MHVDPRVQLKTERVPEHTPVPCPPCGGRFPRGLLLPQAIEGPAQALVLAFFQIPLPRADAPAHRERNSTPHASQTDPTTPSPYPSSRAPHSTRKGPSWPEVLPPLASPPLCLPSSLGLRVNVSSACCRPFLGLPRLGWGRGRGRASGHGLYKACDIIWPGPARVHSVFDQINGWCCMAQG